MNAAFSVLRYTADIARNEPANIGLIGFSQGLTTVLVNDAAIRRVLSTNPDLPSESLEGIEEQLTALLETESPQTLEDAEAIVAQHVYFPLSASKFLPFTLQASVVNAPQQSLRDGLRILEARLVRPKRRATKSRSQSPRESMKKRLDPLIKKQKVSENVKVTGGKSGDERHLSFFANHGSDVGLEIVELPNDFTTETLKMRADALAFEADDIVSSPDSIGSLIIYVPVDRRKNLAEFPAMARERVKGLKNVAIYDYEGAAIGKFLADAKIDPAESMAAD